MALAFKLIPLCLSVGIAIAQRNPEIEECSGTRSIRRKIVSNFEIVEFSLPLFAKMKKVADIDYIEYYVWYGPMRDKVFMRFMLGPLTGGGAPNKLTDPASKWVEQTWSAGDGTHGSNWFGVGPDGKKWRHLSIPFGFATYKAVPDKAAAYFDKILDTMCYNPR